nr:hypothetical protein [Nocardioides sp. J54]
MLPHEGDGSVRRYTVEDGQARERGPGAAAAAVAGDLDPFLC